MKPVQIYFALRHSISCVVSWNDCNVEINLVLLKWLLCLNKLWTLSWVARWMETGGKKKQPWEAKPIKMSIKARGFKVMSGSQWCAGQLLSSPCTSHLISWWWIPTSASSQEWALRGSIWSWSWPWDMAGWFPLWEEQAPCLPEAGSLQLPLPDGQAERLNRCLEPSRYLLEN